MIGCRAATVRDLLTAARYAPALMQREFQWTEAQIGQLVDDLERFIAGLRPFDPGSPPQLDALSPPADTDDPRAEDDGAPDDEPPEHENPVAQDPGYPEEPADPQEPADPEEPADPAAAALDGAPFDERAGPEDPTARVDLDAEERAAAARVDLLKRARAAPSRYFLGAITLHASPRRRAVHVYDGLQRLTSLVLILAALRDGWRDRAAPQIAEIGALLLSAEKRGEDRRLSIPGTGRALAILIGGTNKRGAPSPSIDDRATDRHIKAGYAYLLGRFQRWSDADRAQMLDHLLDRVMVAAITLDEEALAYQAFVTANSRGLGLDFPAIVKALLFDVVEAHLTVEEKAQLDREWKALAKRQGARDAFSDLLYASETIRFRPYHRERDAPRFAQPEPGETLTKALEADAAPPTRAAAAAAWTVWARHTLAAEAACFNELRFDPHEEVYGRALAILRLGFLPWRHWEPVGIRILRSGFRPAVVTWLFHRLERACYVLFLNRQRDGYIREVMSRALYDLEQGRPPAGGDGPSGLRPLDFFDTVARAACNGLAQGFPDYEGRRAATLWLESLLWGRRVPSGVARGVTVEHVLPVGGGAGWTEPVWPDEARKRCLHLVGNLALVPGALNTWQLGRKPWAAKRALLQPIAEEFRLARDAVAEEEWTPEVVDARTARLVEAAWRHLRGG